MSSLEADLDRRDALHVLDDAGARRIGGEAADELRVLLVEDDDADAYLIELALNANQKVKQVVRARDGVEALELLGNNAVRPDLAIIDLNMPRKDGFSLLRDIDARGDYDLPAVVFTSSRSGADTLRAKKRGALLFQTKPTRAKDFISVVDGLLSDIKARKRLPV